MTDISRTLGKHKKRNVCVMALEINASDMAAAGAYELAVLPTNVLITATALVSVVAFDGTTPTIAVGFNGGAELLAATTIAAAADTVAAGNGNIAQQTGPQITMDKVGTSTVGKYIFIIEYVEYEQATGELTNFIPEQQAGIVQPALEIGWAFQEEDMTDKTDKKKESKKKPEVKKAARPHRGLNSKQEEVS